jgi:ferredoxin-like protein FixX
VTLRTVAGRRVGETAEDLQVWLRQLDGCPPISLTVLATCPSEQHADEPATWFYVEADARESTARRRCLSCGRTSDVLDSAEHWNYPRMWSCAGCGQSIAEVAAGLHVEDGDGEDADGVTWVAVAARCVECGLIEGLTDFNVDPIDSEAITARL